MRKGYSTKLLFERQENCVCKRCGGSLEVRTVTQNIYGGQSLDLYCPNCHCVEYGTEKVVFQMAQSFMEKFEFNYFLDLEEDEKSRQLNISLLCDIMAWAVNYKENQESE